MGGGGPGRQKDGQETKGEGGKESEKAEQSRNEPIGADCVGEG